MSQREKDSHEWKKRHFREIFGFELEELEDTVWDLAREQDRIPNVENPDERYGCSLCDGWLALEDISLHEIYSGDNLASFHAHIATAHKELPKFDWPSIIKK